MELHEFFEREIQKVQSIEYQDFLRYYFDTYVGNWFWNSGASASGKYHPEFARGNGGLVRHTRAVVWICEELMRMSSYSYMKDEYKDYALMACLLHDTAKYGTDSEENADCYKNHGAIAASAVNEAWESYFHRPAPEFLLLAIKSHMGQWVENKEDRPFTNIDRIVHLADYIASRSFFDIPQITAEYEVDEERFNAELELDFSDIFEGTI